MSNSRVVRVILDLGCFVYDYSIAFHYPLGSGCAINDIFVCFMSIDLQEGKRYITLNPTHPLFLHRFYH